MILVSGVLASRVEHSVSGRASPTAIYVSDTLGPTANRCNRRWSTEERFGVQFPYSNERDLYSVYEFLGTQIFEE